MLLFVIVYLFICLVCGVTAVVGLFVVFVVFVVSSVRWKKKVLLLIIFTVGLFSSCGCVFIFGCLFLFVCCFIDFPRFQLCWFVD